MFGTPHFGDDYFFKGEALAATAKTSEAFDLGRTQGGFKIRGFADGTISTAATKTITFAVAVADTADAASWTTIKTETFTATGTSVTGDLFSFIPDSDAKFVRVSVTGSEGTTGKVTVAPEYLPR